MNVKFRIPANDLPEGAVASSYLGKPLVIENMGDKDVVGKIIGAGQSAAGIEITAELNDEWAVRAVFADVEAGVSMFQMWGGRS